MAAASAPCPFAAWAKCDGPPRCNRSHDPTTIAYLEARYPRHCASYFVGRCDRGDGCRHPHIVTQRGWKTSAAGAGRGGGGGGGALLLPPAHYPPFFHPNYDSERLGTALIDAFVLVNPPFLIGWCTTVFAGSEEANRAHAIAVQSLKGRTDDARRQGWTVTIGDLEDEKRFPWLIVFRIGLECLTLIDIESCV